MKIIIIDDEKSLLIILKKMLSKISQIDIVGIFQDTHEADQFLKNHLVDMIFMDINMPGENGLDFAKRLSGEMPSIDIVFLTAYREYALEAFEVYAFDYIVKPISQERLIKTIDRAIKRRHFVAYEEEIIVGNNLSVYCLGRVGLKNSQGLSIPLFSSKSEELLSYLVFNRGKEVSKWRIIEELFRGMPRYNAETYLNTTIYKLRKALQPYGMKEIIISESGNYKIDLRNIYVDFIDFEKRLQETPVEEVQNTEEALQIEALFEGDLFADKGYDWSLAERERLSLMYHHFAKQLGKYLIKIGNYQLALKILKKIEMRDELDEETNCLLMKIYALQKDKVYLTKQFVRYTERLKKELDILPEQTTIAFYEKLKKTL